MEAQAVIQVALNNPDVAPKGEDSKHVPQIEFKVNIQWMLANKRSLFLLSELQIRRQNSSESISSLNSITSHSSVGSLKDDAKKKKKKSWVGGKKEPKMEL